MYSILELGTSGSCMWKGWLWLNFRVDAWKLWWLWGKTNLYLSMSCFWKHSMKADLGRIMENIPLQIIGAQVFKSLSIWNICYFLRSHPNSFQICQRYLSSQCTQVVYYPVFVNRGSCGVQGDKDQADHNFTIWELEVFSDCPLQMGFSKSFLNCLHLLEMLFPTLSKWLLQIWVLQESFKMFRSPKIVQLWFGVRELAVECSQRDAEFNSGKRPILR